MKVSPLAAHKRDLALLDRRALLTATGAAVLQSFLPRAASAKAKELVFANFGGDAVDAAKKAYGEPFTQDTGIPVVVDGASPLPGKIKAMVESGQIVWDVCDADGFSSMQLGDAGLLEAIDYSIVDKTKIHPGFIYTYGVMSYIYSFVLAYDRTKFPDRPPTYQDFFDTARYPGKRTLWKYQCGATEPCLLADGVGASELYSMPAEAHVKRALAKAKTLGQDIIYWDSGADSQQMFLDGEVTMGVIWSSRAVNLERDTNGRVTWTWNQGLFCPGAYVIPKGAPAGIDAQRFLASILTPERQLVAMGMMAQGPSNPAASALATESLKRGDPGYEPNFKQQILRGEDWYAKNYDSAAALWFDGIST